MKKLLLVLTISSSLTAMETIDLTDEEEQEQNKIIASRLFVKNTTDDPVTIAHSSDGQLFAWRVVRPQCILYLPNPDDITAFKVLPYGDIKGILEKETLSLKILKQPNHKYEILRHLKKDNPRDIFFEVHLDGSFSPYKPVSYHQSRDSNPTPPTTLAEVFPFLDEIINGEKSLISSFTGKNRRVLARYVLNIPKNADAHSIEKAYESTKERWDYLEDTLATQVDFLIEQSHKTLQAELAIKKAKQKHKEEERTLQKLADKLFRNGGKDALQKSFSIDGEQLP